MNYDSGHGPVRVLHVIENLGTGGMENGVVNLVNLHRPDRVVADVLCLRSTGDFARRIPQGKLYFQPEVGASMWRATKAVAGQCRRRGYDIVHAHSWATLIPAFFGTRLAGSTRFVHGEHGTLYLDSRKRAWIQKALFNKADRCLSVSESLKLEIVTTLGLDADSFHVIQNGVDIDRFTSPEEARTSLCAELGIGDDADIIGSVGRLVAVKDYPTLLAAFARLRQESASKAHLVFVGDGPERHTLESIAIAAEVSDHVTFMGRRDDVANLLPGFDIFVLPSVHEGMSNTLIEAAASGVPAIASNIAANRDVVIDGETGLFFTTGSSESLHKMLKTLTSDRVLRRQMSDNAVSLARQNFSLSGMVSRYEQFYTNMLKQRPRASQPAD